MEDKRTSSSSIASSTRTQMPKSTAEKSKPAPSSNGVQFNLKTVMILLLLAVAIGSSIYFYTKYKDSQDQLKNPQTAVQAQTSELVDKVAKHTDLPDESPTIATVSDVSKLSGQSFFASAKNGDKVLIYAKEKKAVLYRPSEDKVVNIAPLNTATQPTQ